MAKYHDIDAEIWEELLDYTPKQILVYIYLFSNPLCRPSGLYRIRTETIKHHTKCGEDSLKSICGKLVEYDFETSEVWVRGKMKRILSGFKNNEKMRLSVKSDFDGLKSFSIKSLFVSKYEGALEGLVSPPLTLPLPLALPLKNNIEEKKKEKVGEEGLVLLSPEERQKLSEKMGGKKAAEYIQKLEHYIGSKGKRYRSHYHTILSWWMKDGKPKDPVKIDDSAEKIKRWAAEASPMPEECKEQLQKFGIKSAVA